MASPDTTSAEELIRRGDAPAALAQLTEQVRRAPADAKLRVFLFQLLAVLGQWDRAMTQLKVAGDLDDGALAMVQTYREALRCEPLRAEIFAGRRTPLVLGKPPQWMALVMEALRLAGAGHQAEAERLRGEGFEAAPAVAGTINDQPFAWIADADMRLGPVLELITNGRYYWLPFERIRELDVEEPADLRDLVWTPARLLLTNGGETFGLIPTRYVGSEASDDPAIQAARKTEWQDDGSGLFCGLGQRLLATDQDEYPIMDLRQVRLDSPDWSEDETAGESA